MKKTVFLWLMTTLLFQASAQNISFKILDEETNSDSLNMIFKKEFPNTYVNQLISLENTWYLERNKKFGSNFQLIESLSKKLNRKDVIPILEFMKGRDFVLKQKPDLAFKYFTSSLNTSKFRKDTIGIIINLMQLVDLNMNQTLESYRNYDQAYIYVNEAYKIGKKFNNDLYKLKTINELIKVSMSNNVKIKNFKKLLDEQKRIIDSNPKLSNFKVNYANNLAKYYYDKGEMEKSYEILKTNILPEKIYGSRFNYFGYLSNVVNMAIRLKKFDEANKLAIYIINSSQEIELRIIRQRVYELLKKLSIEIKEYDKALIYADSSFAIKEAIFKDESTLKLNSLVETLKSKEINIKNKLLEKENQIIKSRNRLTSFGILFGILIIAILTIALYFNYRKNLKIEHQSKKILDLVKIKDKYFTIVAHDLRMPLTSYQGLASSIQYLIKTKQYEEINEISDKIDIMGANLSLMLNNLLNWNNSQDLSFKPKFERLHLVNILNSILPIYLDLGKLKNIEFNVNLKEEFFINAEYNTISVVLRNILDNALKNCGGSKQIYIDVQFNQNKNTIDLCIKNSLDNVYNKGLNEIINFLNSNSEQTYEGASLGLELIKKFSKINNVDLLSKIEDTYFILILSLKNSE